jgi:hypothetical protein
MVHAVAVGLTGCLLSCLAGCHRQKPLPSIDGLSAALERSAEKTLSAPSLADEQIIVSASSGESGAQTSEIVRAFAAAGGTAVSSVNAQGQVSILASIPEPNVAAFKAALRHEQLPIQKGPAPGPSAPTRLIEVLIEATPTPTP